MNEVVPGSLCPAVVLATTLTSYDVAGDRVVYDTLVPLVVLVEPPFSVTVYVTSQLAVEEVQLIDAEVEVTLEVPTLVGVVGTAHGYENDPDPPSVKLGEFVFSNHVAAPSLV